MRFSVLPLAVLLVSCRNEPAVTVTTDTRAPIEVGYVGAPELQVHKKMDDASPVITTYLNGETVSLLARKGDWVEVKTAGESGWAHAADLTSAENAVVDQKNPKPKFRVMPAPVVQPGAHGTIYIEANVNDQGEVTSTKLITNSTGSDGLAAQNEAALHRARFYPIVQKGQRTPFVYYYRVDY